MSRKGKSEDKNTDDFNQKEEAQEESYSSNGLGDIFKKIASVGMGAAFMTEESIKGVLNDLPVSKEIISGLVNNAKGAKEDFTKGLSEEFRKYLGHLDKESLIDHLVQNYDVEVNASFKFKKKINAENEDNQE